MAESSKNVGLVSRLARPVALAATLFEASGCGKECTVDGPGESAKSEARVLSLCGANAETFMKCVDENATDSDDAFDFYCQDPELADVVDEAFYYSDDIFCRQARTAAEIHVVCE